MKVIQDKIQALQDFQATAQARVIKSCSRYEAEIIDMNTDQLFQGETSNQTEIRPGYRPLTVTIKRAKGQPTDRVTLRDTGDFYGAFQVRFNDRAGHLAIFSDDDKAAKLERKYGKDIYGLNPDNQDDLAQMILPDMRNELRKAI